MSGNPHINILSSNYNRYGTSVFQTLYHDERADRSELDGSDRQRMSSDARSMRKPPGSGTADEADRTSSKIKRKYRSLVQSYGGNRSVRAKKFIGKLHDHSSSDSFSIFSLRSSYSNRNLATAQPKTASTGTGAQHAAIFEISRPYDDINALPVELLALVMQQFTAGACLEDPKTLVMGLYVNKKFYEATKNELYEAPSFTSTYRVAQFVTSLRVSPKNGLLVRHINLSELRNGLMDGCRDNANEQSRSEDEHRFAREIAPTREILQEEREDGFDDDDQREGTDVNGDRHDPESGRVLTQIEEDLPDVALAGWRDWRYRYDPLYGNHLLSCHNNLRKVASRSSSIHSTATTGTGANTKRSHRSNSSVSSFTSSIMSSFYNSSSFSSLSLTASFDSKTGVEQGKWFSKLFSSKKTAKQRREKFVEAQLRNYNNIDESSVDHSRGSSDNKNCVKFSIQTNLKDQPFSERHPVTNKFLLKYSLSKDIPLGYLFHIVHHCPNILSLNLANLVLSADFQVHLRMDPARMHRSSLLPDVEVATSSEDALLGKNLEPVYFTDSSKGHAFYGGNTSAKLKVLDELHFVSPYTMLGESWISSKYPPPIDQHTKIRSQRVRNRRIQNYNLTKLEVRDLFHLVYEKLTRLTHLQMDNVVWCNQPDVKEFVFSSLEKNADLNVSFAHAGMGRNLSWASKGSVSQFVAIVLLGEILDRDDLYLEDLFNVRTERFSFNANRDHLLLGRSNKLLVHTYNQQTLQCTLLLRRSCSLGLETTLASDSTIICEIALGGMPPDCDESLTRVHELARELLNRLENLRTANLHRHIGENQYIFH
ncbi:LADA_0D04940g1_1 [Lachancea dasiensis]|uniref:LADA_0D04940g1_1 n=1 Tax=Lachancea dasiensis TaxID=1072105 RepID=A0A1G4J5U9_9SACH|nr:LADA_0D04940g1_1 [Lachancea dasiensis]